MIRALLNNPWLRWLPLLAVLTLVAYMAAFSNRIPVPSRPPAVGEADPERQAAELEKKVELAHARPPGSDWGNWTILERASRGRGAREPAPPPELELLWPPEVELVKFRGGKAGDATLWEIEGSLPLTRNLVVWSGHFAAAIAGDPGGAAPGRILHAARSVLAAILVGRFPAGGAVWIQVTGNPGLGVPYVWRTWIRQAPPTFLEGFISRRSVLALPPERSRTPITAESVSPEILRGLPPSLRPERAFAAEFAGARRGYILEIPSRDAVKDLRRFLASAAPAGWDDVRLYNSRSGGSFLETRSPAYLLQAIAESGPDGPSSRITLKAVLKGVSAPARGNE